MKKLLLVGTILLSPIPAFAQLAGAGSDHSGISVTPTDTATQLGLGAAFAARLPLTGGTISGTLNTTTGLQQNGQTIVRVFGNSGNVGTVGVNTDTLVGVGAGANLPAADYLTTAVGWHALNATTLSNTESTAVGWNSQGSITTGNMNTTLGINTLGTCLTCVHDIQIGTDSMRNGLGSYNVGIGVSTLINDGGGSNIAIGDSTYQSNSSASGSLNIAIGWNTFNGLNLTTGSKNIIIGAASGNSITTGNSNVFIGNTTATAVTNAFNSVAIGANAGQKMTGNGVNTYLGAGAAQNATSAQQSTVIGSGIGASTFATGSGVLLIGSGKNTVDTPTAGTSNYVNIENVIAVTNTNSNPVVTLPGGSLQVGSGSTLATTSTGELGILKITDSGTAPGAGYLKMSIVAGTTTGTCKIIARAGTSTTPITIVDNVGSGC